MITFPRLLIITLMIFVCCVGRALADENVWKPIDPAHLALKTPVVEKDADAEAIFWEVKVVSESGRTTLANYIRIKVFTDRGKASQGTVSLPYFEDTAIEDIAGRTIKPDGSIVDLRPDAIFEQTLARTRGRKLLAKSFAMPAVEPGAIIEYRWREVLRGRYAYVKLQFQRDIPIHLIRYLIKPLSDRHYSMQTQSFRLRATPMGKNDDGFYVTEMIKVPAFRREPYMPPDDEVRSWMLLYYAGDIFWFEVRKEEFNDYKARMKVDDEVQKTAATVIGDAATPDQKLERLYDFCRTRIKNTDDDASGIKGEAREKLKENKRASDTLKRGMGTGFEIDLLFGALAIAAGFDARVTSICDRSNTFFVPKLADAYLNLYFMNSYNIAVQVGGQWRFFDPATTYAPYGMLRWQEEGLIAMISDPQRSVTAITPLSLPEKSVQKRTANLRLSEDGALEGDVQIEYSGHFAIEQKEYNDDLSPEQREQALRDFIKGRMNTAEITNVRVENAADPIKPFTYSFHMRIPDYAQRTGKRLFLQPAFFQRGASQMFTNSERRHPVYFNYPWAEQDEVKIELPAGYSLDNPEAPAPVFVAKIADYKVKMTLENNRTLVYRRSFKFGEGGLILFPVKAYADLKQLFGDIHQQDNHTITIKQGDAAAK